MGTEVDPKGAYVLGGEGRRRADWKMSASW